ncbi:MULTISPECIES: hypothetical protein [Amycolatopsis]|uniref:DUF2076 domain-containing protein n=1 Tax=Amycolatopsis bullii TaxID=941987 RepID=A0ABQ3KJB2_9PSEU|nr:hypothetical protein [Amycolatopsis bullii]GHG29699.1 hypothetical protein GCM10017567_56760 [Amycolatopsis bullii]
MGLLNRLFGRRSQGQYGQVPYRYHGDGYLPGQYSGQPGGPVAQPGGHPAQSEDERAIERYRYLLRTAPPDQVEAAHAEAFAKLTPQQRQQVLQQLADAVPESERPRTDDPQGLARVATRAEFRQPGFLERTFGGYGRDGYGVYGRGYGGGGFGMGGGMGMGSMIGGSLLGTVAGVVVGSAVADALFDTGLGDGGLFGGGDEEAYAAGYEDGYDQGDAADSAADYGDDFGSGDDFGDV